MSSEPLVPDTLIRRVRVVPLTGPAPEQPVDLRIRGGAVVEVGPDLDEQGCTAYDAEGRWAMPGLWDQHVHLAQWGATMTRLDTSGTQSVGEVLDRVRRHVASLGADDQDTVFGWGHRSATWPEPPTVAALDAVVSDRPVVLVAGDGHHGWLNSVALRALGVRDITGVLAENAWFPLYARLQELPGAVAAGERGYAEAVARANAMGVVGVGDMEFDSGFAQWPARFLSGVDTLRARVATYEDRLADVAAAGLRTGDDLLAGHREGGSAGLVTMGPLKVISDGSLNTLTAWCCEPYVDSGHLDWPSGGTNMDIEILAPLLSEARAAGLTAAVHAIGDEALSCALDAFEVSGQRGSIEHAQLVAWADLSRMARLDLLASVQPAHLLDDRDVAQRWWTDRTDRVYAFRAMLDAGIRLGLGSDAPVSPLDPWLAVAAAVHRTGDDREPWHPEQALTAREALAASVDGQPTLGVGSRGDVILLDADPLGGPTDDGPGHAAYLRGMPVTATFLAGRIVHDGL